MDAFIESQTHNVIFHDPKFVDRFLSGDQAKLEAIEEYCQKNNAYYGKHHEWELPEITSERCLYEPVLEILNTIKRGVHSLPTCTNPFGLFQDRSLQWIKCSESDEYWSEATLIKPDLVLFEEPREHWETVRMTVEIKKLRSYQKVAMKQLTRYARAMFAHQLHRRHLYAMMVCGAEATFVRFDRAGILYSERIDLQRNAKTFTRAFASLLLLDRMDEGYDTAFTKRTSQEGQLEYWIDLPVFASDNETAGAVAGPTDEPALVNVGGPTSKFKVVGILYHRQSICGRATIVLHIRKALDSDLALEPEKKDKPTAKRKRSEMELCDPAEYVLKMMWRDRELESEGEVLEKLQGSYGLAEHVWHCDVPGKCRCSPAKERCETCVDKTAQVKELMVCDNLTDISISAPLSDYSDDPVLGNSVPIGVVSVC
jgi:hypothetical protein